MGEEREGGRRGDERDLPLWGLTIIRATALVLSSVLVLDAGLSLTNWPIRGPRSSARLKVSPLGRADLRIVEIIRV